MSWNLTQNPGIGGLDEITDAEALFLQNLSGLTYTAGDILYHDGNDLVNLGIGTNGQVLATNAGADAPEWISGGNTDEKVGVDSGATPGYLGAANNDGVLRTGTPISYTDGGDFITLDIVANGINDTHIDWGTGANQVSAVDIPIADGGSVLTATEVETSLQEVKIVEDRALSPMVITGGEITEGTNAGTYKVAALTAYLRATDSETGALTYVTLAEQDNQTLAAADTTYIISLNYNGGSPTITTVASSPYTADKRNIPIGKVMKDGSDDVHYISGGYNFQDGVKKLHERNSILRALELNGGSTIAYSGTNNFTMTEGIAFGGINKFVLSAYNSATTQFIPVYGDGGAGFTEGAARNTIDFEHYDDGDGTLGEVGVAKYSCHWVYKHIDDDDVYVVYGTCNDTLAVTESSTEPSKPDHLTDFGILVGKIVAPQAGGSFSAIQMVSDTFFTGTAVSDHNLLGSLQGGTASEYYHLTSANHTALTAGFTGTGNLVRETSPTLVTPALGTPSALVGTNISGTAASLTAGAVSTITGLAPDTATTQATQPNITTCAALTTVGTIGTGVWNGTAITDTYLDGITLASGSLTLAGADVLTLTTTAATNVTLPTTGTLSAIAGTETLTNKRITPRIVTTTNDATAEIDIDVTDQYQLTAMSAATTFTVTGTAVAGQKLVVRLEDDGTTRGLTWNAIFRASTDLALPTDTTATKTLYCGFIYNATDTKWDLVALLDNI